MKKGFSGLLVAASALTVLVCSFSAVALPILNPIGQCYGLAKCQKYPAQCNGNKQKGFSVTMKRRACENAGGTFKR